MRRFTDRVVVVTGAASGIGRALAREFAADGAKLALADVDAEGLRETAALAGVERCLTAVVDVADRAAVERFACDVVARFGAVHVVINNAGVTVSETIERLGYDDFAWLMGIGVEAGVPEDVGANAAGVHAMHGDARAGELLP